MKSLVEEARYTAVQSEGLLVVGELVVTVREERHTAGQGQGLVKCVVRLAD
jgi:hypothetical protein